MHIQVFRTNVRFKKQLKLLVPYMNNLEGIRKWNIDFHDAERILRIETDRIAPHAVRATLLKAGFQCEELEN
ncbi:MAG TPA: hypothetical protein VM012_15055 [Flavitalea sp.]|nr:hypothetical protein [Flavitalea sp.]